MHTASFITITYISIGFSHCVCVSVSFSKMSSFTRMIFVTYTWSKHQLKSRITFSMLNCGWIAAIHSIGHDCAHVIQFRITFIMSSGKTLRDILLRSIPCLIGPAYELLWRHNRSRNCTIGQGRYYESAREGWYYSNRRTCGPEAGIKGRDE